MKIIKDYLLKNFTALKIGGEAKYFIVVKNEDELLEALQLAKKKRLPWYVVGEGSNLVVNDNGYKGMVIQNQILRFNLSLGPSPALGEGNMKKGFPLQVMGRGKGRGRVVVGAGENLLEVISKLNKAGLKGMEKMAGIPGTVGGAIYGCAGAYGQEIKDHLVKVKIWDGKKFRYLNQKQCQFGYRESIFKRRKNWIILEAFFKLGAGNSTELKKISREIIKLRQKKYWPGLKCPGSFFKNILLADVYPLTLRKKFVKKIKSDKIIMYGKVPTGHLLEKIGAKGMRQGSIRVANHHANLIYNTNGGKASDIKKLAKELKIMIRRRFGIKIKEEVQYL